MEITLTRIKFTVEPVVGPPGDDAPAGAGGELEGYWFVAAEVDAAGEPTGNAVRYPVQVAAAELLAATLAEHLAVAVRRTDDAPLLELVDGAPPQPQPAPVNREERRRERFGNGHRAQTRGALPPTSGVAP
jgi:hypothetical protein